MTLCHQANTSILLLQLALGSCELVILLVVRILLRTLTKLSNTTPGVATLSQQSPPNFNDLYEYYDPDARSPISSRQQNITPQSQRPPRSSSSAGTRSLRRTQPLQERNTSQTTTVSPEHRQPEIREATPAKPAGRSPRDHSPELSFDRSRSTTPETFQNLASNESFWPKRTTRISRRTHDAILFTLEAIRKGKGTDWKPLSPDTPEETAHMSDLLGASQPGGSSSALRAQNGGTRAAQGPVPVVGSDPPRGVRTPTDVMRARREREERRRAAQEAAQRQREEEELRRPQGQSVAEDQPTQRRSSGRRFGAEQVAQESSRRTSVGASVGATSRRQENIPPTGPSSTRPRGTSSVDQGQPRPVSAPQQPRVSSGSRYDQQARQEPQGRTSSRRSRNEPLDQTNQPTESARPTGQPSSSQQPQQPSARAGFPHAFERWEALSSHWEGLTSFWIRRLQENSNELSRDPINQQMSRQITDLSAAGANLFHAVVELQRLRASSERKFQRWFFETRTEQERAQEIQAELERLLRVEREERGQAISSIGAAQADKIKAEEAVKEMRRELQISKEEARRAWEELGRREQEERERTISLRSGEPTLVGGVQVVPMTHRAPSRQTGAANPTPSREVQTAAAGPSALSRQETSTSLNSPEDEQQQFTYVQAEAASPAATDPFTESIPTPVRPQQYETRPTQPPTSSAAIAAATWMAPTEAGRSSARPYPQSSAPGSSDPHFYQHTGHDTVLNPPGRGSSAFSPTGRPGTATDPSDNRSYIPSTTSGNGSSIAEEDYEINPDGSYSHDAQGRRIPWQGTGRSLGERIQSDDGSDEYDVTSELEREGIYRQRYGIGAGAALGAQESSIATASSSAAYAQPSQPSAYPQIASQQLPPPEMQQTSAADYSGQGWGGDWEGLTSTHRHPTRLSDIQEERSGRTSPSRASFVSGGGESSRGAPPDVGSAYGRSGR